MFAFVLCLFDAMRRLIPFRNEILTPPGLTKRVALLLQAHDAAIPFKTIHSDASSQTAHDGRWHALVLHSIAVNDASAASAQVLTVHAGGDFVLDGLAGKFCRRVTRHR